MKRTYRIIRRLFSSSQILALRSFSLLVQLQIFYSSHQEFRHFLRMVLLYHPNMIVRMRLFLPLLSTNSFIYISENDIRFFRWIISSFGSMRNVKNKVSIHFAVWYYFFFFLLLMWFGRKSMRDKIVGNLLSSVKRSNCRNSLRNEIVNSSFRKFKIYNLLEKYLQKILKKLLTSFISALYFLKYFSRLTNNTPGTSSAIKPKNSIICQFSSMSELIYTNRT